MGMGEILVVALVALLIWGPQKLPEILRTLGKFTSTLKKASADLTTQVKRELEEEKKESVSPPKKNSDNKETSPVETETKEASLKKKAGTEHK